MNEDIIHLTGDHKEIFYQLGLKEKESFFDLEKNISLLLSKINLLGIGNQILSRSKLMMKKKSTSFFKECLTAYSDGLGIKSDRYENLIQMLEVAAHYGQVYPDLKNLIPGCTSVLKESAGDFTHSRILDFPLINLSKSKKKNYFWDFKNKSSFLSFSFEGLAPIVFQAFHSHGLTFALHFKPSNDQFYDGPSISEIVLSSLLESKNLNELKDHIKSYHSQTKWGIIACQDDGKVLSLDIEGPKIDFEFFNLNDSSPLVFTNLPLKSSTNEAPSFIQFCKNREKFILKKLKNHPKAHPLELMTELPQKKSNDGPYSTLTLSSVAAYHLNLTSGYIDFKDSSGIVLPSDPVLRLELSGPKKITLQKSQTDLTPMEQSWKKAACAQNLYDQKKFNEAYHELQLAIALCPHEVWGNIFSFYQCIWEFQFLSNNTELSLVYKDLIRLKLPQELVPHHQLMIFRFEKKLQLVSTISKDSLPNYYKDLLKLESEASTPLFTAWMNLLYPRLDILDILSPYFKS
jgi:hypothetical protein